MEYKYNVNGVNYVSEFTLENSDGEKFEIPKSLVRGMNIEDNLFEPFMRGVITLANPYDLVEDDYSFRGDGGDTIKIKFYPEKNPNDVIFDEEFVVVEDDNYINPSTRGENHKNFQLKHKDMIPFLEKIPHGKKYHGKIGDILKYIFEKEMELKTDKWDSGDFTLTYIPPSTYRYIDVVYYLLKLFFGKSGNSYIKGFISYDQKNKKYNLELLSDIFKENSNQERLIEAFSIGDFASRNYTNNPSNPPKDAEVDKHYSILPNITYSTPMHGWNNSYFTNRLVFSYDKILGIQRVESMKIKDFVSKWRQMFVDVFKCLGGRPTPFVIQNDNSDKKFRHFKTPYPMEIAKKIVEADFHNILTFYNLQVIFSNVGMLGRFSGKFLDIVKFGKDESKHDKKMLGRWFITNVTHTFLGDNYTNSFTASKTYIGP